MSDDTIDDATSSAAMADRLAGVVAALARQGVAMITVAGGSMAPTLALGQRVLVRRGQPAVGDVVLLRGRDAPILHRLVARIDLPAFHRFVHRGDAVGARAGLCRHQDVLAIADLSRRVPDPAATGRGYDRGAATYDARFQARPATVRRFARLDAHQLAIARRGRVLELGCGSGRLLLAAHAELRVGVDVSASLLAQARSRGLAVARADAHALPFRDATFDAVLAGNGVFRYLDYGRAFTECARVLAPGGRLAVHQYAADPWRPLAALRGRLPPEPLHLRHLDELIQPASRAGFTIDQCALYRDLRLPPYLVRLPRQLAGRLWQHVVFVFRKPIG